MGGGSGTTDTSMTQRPNSSPSSIPKQIIPNHHSNPPPLIRSSPQTFTGAAAGNRAGAPPPIPPYSQIPATLQLKHSRSTSQPSSFFSFDSLPPLNPSPASAEERNAAGFSPSLPPSPFTMCHSSSRIIDGENLPPRKSHRRSNSDVTFGFSSSLKSPPPLIPSRSLERSVSGGGEGGASDWSSLVKEEPGRRSESEAMDDIFRAYMNLDNIDVLNSFGGGNNNNEEMESSGTRKTASSDSEGESSAACGNNNAKVVSSGVKRRAGGDIVPTGSRHYRSVSMDSGFMGKFDFGGDEKLQTSLVVKASPTNSGEGNNSSSVEFGNGEFTAAEIKKISADEKLAEIVMSDPKRVKRILANRVSAARSKERKTQYMAELEHKVQTLQSEATTLSAQLTHLQRDSMGLTNQNNELKFRLQAMEQQAQLRDALSEKLTEEVQRLKLVIGETSSRSSRRESKTTLSPEMFQQLSISQLQEQQMQHSKAQIK
ncbi:bZIP transcription factor 30 [Hirschfeldia incana]|nr:bZIP transcription factor 30 [Hirschfeldia incana]